MNKKEKKKIQGREKKKIQEKEKNNIEKRKKKREYWEEKEKFHMYISNYIPLYRIKC